MVTFLSKNLENVRSDTLPENTGYRDDGCDLSSSCLKDIGWILFSFAIK